MTEEEKKIIEVQEALKGYAVSIFDGCTHQDHGDFTKEVYPHNTSDLLLYWNTKYADKAKVIIIRPCKKHIKVWYKRNVGWEIYEKD